jgi:outer membrane protein assembly factor BamB
MHRGQTPVNIRAKLKGATVMTTRLKGAFGLAAMLLALAWTPAAMAKGGTWPQLGYNPGHTGFNNSETKINAKNVVKLANTGTFATGGAVLTPLISGGIVYVRSDDQNIYAWKLKSKKLLWSIPLGTLDGPNGMVVGDHILVATCGFTNSSGICAFDAKTGKEVWTYGLPNGGPFTPPVIDGNTVYLGQSGQNGSANSYNMVAVDLKTGVQRWAFGPCANGLCNGMGSSAPAVDSGMVYFGCAGSSGETVDVTGICALDASTGALVWQYQLGVSFAGDGAGRLIAQSGTVYAAYMTANCYQCGYTIDVTAVNGSTGAEIWDTALTGQLNQSYYPLGAPVLGPDGTVYEGISTNNNSDQPNQFAVNADGSLKWQVSTVPSFDAPSTIVGKSGKSVLFLACSGGENGGTTCGLDASNGSVLWNSSDQGLASYDSFAPVVTGDAVYNDCNDNDLCRYELP